MKQLNHILKKRDLANLYQAFFFSIGIPFFAEAKNARSNYWLNAIMIPDRQSRDEFLEETNKANVMTRPVWKLLNKLPMYEDCQTDALTNALWLEDRIVNIPSSVCI